jgi:SNF2 family DNA or RNA helicase
MFRAICGLDSVSRWAVTGTPVQNGLGDLAALLRFIRAYPYDNSKHFAKDISKPWKDGNDEAVKEAVNKLKLLSRCLVLRRAKRILALPPRTDLRCPVDFDKLERALYDDIRNQTIIRFDDAELSKPNSFFNFLQQIESMRLVCNMGLRYTTRHDKTKPRDRKSWAENAQKSFNIQRNILMNNMRCSQCSSSLEVTESLGDDSGPQDSPYFFQCLKYACAECSSKNRIHKQKMACGCTPVCPIAPVSLSNSAFEEIGDMLEEPHWIQSPDHGPSKVKALLEDLRQQDEDVKWCVASFHIIHQGSDMISIVFSAWRMTLDIVEAALNQAHIRSVRLDGKTPQIQRQSILNSFKTKPEVRCILLTLQCGAVGYVQVHFPIERLLTRMCRLTLTEASRAYLMEPQW